MSQHLLWLTSVRDLKELEPAQFNWLKEEGLARGFPDPFIHHFLQMDDQEKLGKLVLAIKDPALTVFMQKKLKKKFKSRISNSKFYVWKSTF